jgi:redox-sensitive bicupin YhaK (pirin superfamily)
MRLIAGSAYGLKNNVKISSPMFYLHLVMNKGAEFRIPENYSERAIYIVKGSIEISGRNFKQAQMIVFSKDAHPVITAEQDSILLVLGGEPVGERFIWWNFVSSRQERIEQAKEDWKQGRIKLPPNDNKVFIPLPEDKLKPSGRSPKPEPLS